MPTVAPRWQCVVRSCSLAVREQVEPAVWSLVPMGFVRQIVVAVRPGTYRRDVHRAHIGVVDSSDMVAAAALHPEHDGVVPSVRKGRPSNFRRLAALVPGVPMIGHQQLLEGRTREEQGSQTVLMTRRSDGTQTR
jgi:hypothetical protein